MSAKIQMILSRTAVKTFEDLSFLFAFAEDDADAGQGNSAVASKVSFSGAVSGTLFMKLSANVLPELTTNMLGVDEQEETTLDQQYDALKETLNVICGNLLPEIAGKHEIFDIHPPEIVVNEATINQYNGRNHTCKVALAFEEGPCELFLYMDDRLPMNARVSEQE